MFVWLAAAASALLRLLLLLLLTAAAVGGEVMSFLFLAGDLGMSSSLNLPVRSVCQLAQKPGWVFVTTFFGGSSPLRGDCRPAS